MSNFLYRLRDADGALLYVGVTNDWPTRMKQHQRDKAWFPAVAATEVVPIGGNRAQLEAIELAVIKIEAPIHNIQHNERRLSLPAPRPATKITKVSDVHTPGVPMFTHHTGTGGGRHYYAGDFVETASGRGALVSWVPEDVKAQSVHVALSDGRDIVVTAAEIAELNEDIW